MRLQIIAALVFGTAVSAHATPPVLDLTPLRDAFDFRLDSHAHLMTNVTISNERIDKLFTMGSYDKGHGGTRRVTEEPHLGAAVRLEHHNDMDGVGNNRPRTYLHLGPIKIPLSI